MEYHINTVRSVANDTNGALISVRTSSRHTVVCIDGERADGTVSCALILDRAQALLLTRALLACTNEMQES